MNPTCNKCGHPIRDMANATFIPASGGGYYVHTDELEPLRSSRAWWLQP